MFLTIKVCTHAKQIILNRIEYLYENGFGNK